MDMCNVTCPLLISLIGPLQLGCIIILKLPSSLLLVLRFLHIDKILRVSTYINVTNH